MDCFKGIILILFLWNSPNLGWLLRVLKIATKHWVTLVKQLNLKCYDYESWLLKTVGLQWGIFLTKGSLNMCFSVCSSRWQLLAHLESVTELCSEDAAKSVQQCCHMLTSWKRLRVSRGWEEMYFKDYLSKMGFHILSLRPIFFISSRGSVLQTQPLSAMWLYLCKLIMQFYFIFFVLWWSEVTFKGGIDDNLRKTNNFQKLFNLQYF